MSTKLLVQDIHKRFGAHEVLKGVSLTAYAGDVISIIGSSGSGKSTFLRCINLLERPNSGSINVAGEALELQLAHEGRTMVVVTHEMGFAREVSSQVMFLHQGRVEEQGTPGDILLKPRSERLQQFLSGNLK